MLPVWQRLLLRFASGCISFELVCSLSVVLVGPLSAVAWCCLCGRFFLDPKSLSSERVFEVGVSSGLVGWRRKFMLL